jgi:hypothetical protein
MNNINKIRNGSLYYNERRNKVERVLGTVNSQRVWTKRHQENTNDVQIKNLRLAEKEEVDAYVGESK